MSNILTPATLWSDFDDSLDVSANALRSHIEDGIKYESINLLGRETGKGRVVIACK